MQLIRHMFAAALCALLAAGCSEKTRQKTEEAAASAGEDIERGADKVVTRTKEVGRGQETKRALESAGQKIRGKSEEGKDRLRRAGDEVREDAHEVKETTKQAAREARSEIKD